MKYRIVFVMLAVFTYACKEEPTREYVDYVAIQEQEILDYIETNEIEGVLSDDYGVYYKIIDPGVGDKVPYEAKVTVKYKGWLTNDFVFDQTEEGSSYTSSLERLIVGWQIGVPKVAKGGEILLFIPSRYGYGPYVNGDIPANSVLIFRINVTDYE